LGRTDAGTIADWGNRERQTLRALEDLRARPGDERRLWTVYSAGYSYDLTGRIAAIQSPWGVIRYSYRPEASEAVRTLPDGVRSVFRFLPDGRLLSLRHEKDDGLLSEYSYEYAVEGPVSRWTERSGDGHVQSHAATGAEESPDEPVTLATVDSDGAPRRFNLYGERLLASWTASGEVCFFLEDGFGRQRYSVDRSGRLEPFVPAAIRRAGPRVGGALLAPVSHDVFVGGIEVKPGELSDTGRQHGMDTISTSDVGATCFPEWAERTQDVFRAFLNYMGVPGGKTQVLNDLRNSFARNPSEPLTIRAHSNGAITIYQMREALARDIKEGRVKVREIVIAGAGVAKSLSGYFVGHGVNVPVREEDPANRLHDIIRVLTTPLQELGQEVSSPFLNPGSRGALVKYAAGVIALLGPKGDEEIVGLKHHSIPENYPGLLPAVARAGGAAGRFDYRTDPFIGVRQELGGVKLDASGGADWKFGELVGVVYDPAKRALVFLGRRKQSRISASMADFTVALRLARASEEARFTLDPADPKNVRGPWLRAVHFPAEILSGTAFGETMFKADWLMKQYSFHTEVHEDGTQTERHSAVPGFKSVRDLSFEMESPRDSNDRWSRFWIEVDRQKIPTEDDDGIELIEDPRMVIKACRTVPDPSSPQGIRDICDVKDPINTTFIALFTKLYDQIAEESPEFARLKELA
jgi:hypothetical protein